MAFANEHDDISDARGARRYQRILRGKAAGPSWVGRFYQYSARDQPDLFDLCGADLGKDKTSDVASLCECAPRDIWTVFVSHHTAGHRGSQRTRFFQETTGGMDTRKHCGEGAVVADGVWRDLWIGASRIATDGKLTSYAMAGRRDSQGD